MESVVDFIKSNIVLDSYSSSKGFIGFCESEGEWSNNDYLNFLMKIVLDIVGELHVVSSLNIGIRLDDHAQEYSINANNLSCRDYLIEKGIINTKKSNFHDDLFHYDSIVSEEIVFELIRFQTTLGIASGHAFIVDVEKKVAIYPHDDCGLGFIVSDEHGNYQKILRYLEDISKREKKPFNCSFNFK